MAQTDNGTDRNISLVSGWNLIGYTSDTNLSLADTTFNNGTNSYTWAQALSNGKQQAYLAYYDSSPSTVSQRKYKYLSAENGLDDSAFRQGKGYWVYSNQSGNLTLPVIGGTLANQQYAYSKIRVSNGSLELSLTDAGNSTYNWIDLTFKYWGVNPNTKKYGFLDLNGVDDSEEGSKSTVSSQEGVWIKSLQDNIALIRQN